MPLRQTFSLGDGDVTELRRDEEDSFSVNEKSLLNGDVPRRNRNVTYSANQP